jgi:hypothetical protein
MENESSQCERESSVSLSPRHELLRNGDIRFQVNKMKKYQVMNLALRVSQTMIANERYMVPQ